VVDLGGQYSQLIARRVREARVYSEVVSHRSTVEEIRRRNPVALILSGGPASVYADGAPKMDTAIFELGIPTLGICYGAQLLALDLGGRVDRTGVSEFGRTELSDQQSSKCRRLTERQPQSRSGRHHTARHRELSQVCGTRGRTRLWSARPGTQTTWPTQW